MMLALEANQVIGLRMIKLMRGDIQPESAAVAKATQWVRTGLIRQAATVIAFSTAGTSTS